MVNKIVVFSISKEFSVEHLKTLITPRYPSKPNLWRERKEMENGQELFGKKYCRKYRN
jgi:hypothetical protein